MSAIRESSVPFNNLVEPATTAGIVASMADFPELAPEANGKPAGSLDHLLDVSVSIRRRGRPHHHDHRRPAQTRSRLGRRPRSRPSPSPSICSCKASSSPAAKSSSSTIASPSASAKSSTPSSPANGDARPSDFACESPHRRCRNKTAQGRATRRLSRVAPPWVMAA